MSFLYPLGLLGLLAIPVLIFIYIIKSKYTEQTITSTYLWTLSEKFLKRKNPINKITGIISLILQILAVIFISIALAHPVFVLKGRANDYCFVLDGSGSMNTVQEGSTRFEAGKERIRGIINSAADGSTFTLITTGNVTDTVMKQTEDKKTALRQLDAVEPSFVASDFAGAVSEAQKYFSENPACKFYVITDKTFGAEKNVEVINVGSQANNCALEDVDYAFTVGGGVLVSGKAFAYDGDASVTVELFYDGNGRAVASTDVTLIKGEGAGFTIEWNAGEDESLPQFSSLRVAIKEGDSLRLDNEVILYNSHSDASYSTLIVSETPFFIQTSLLAAFSNLKREVVSPKDYNDEMRGYGLYVFQNFTPEKMPEDGAVWFINPDTGVDGTSGFSVRGVEQFKNAVELKLSTSTSSKVTDLLKHTDKSDTTGVTQYIKCGQFRNFTTLMTCNNDPVVFAGTNAYGNREVVFAVDLVETSDFAMSYNARILTYNLIRYTFPEIVEGSSFYCGDSVEINVLANCASIKVELPSGKAEYLDTSTASVKYKLTEVGEYTVTATVGGILQSVKVYSQLPVAERISGATEASFVLNGEPSTVKRDGKYEDLLYAFIILAVIVAADWMVYCYEQYQLR